MPSHEHIDRAAAIDLCHLSRYTAGDETLRRELLILFGDQLSQQLSVLSANCPPEDWSIATHTLKGAARAIGAFQVAETAEKLEQLDPSTQAEQCNRLVGRLRLEADDCRALISSLSSAA